MALKSILEIDVNSESFTAFQALFDRYRADLEALPGAWGKVAAGTEGATNAFNDLAKKQAGRAVAAVAESKALETSGNLTKTQADYWHRMAADAKKVYGHVDDTTKSLMKWTMLKGVLGGLLGAGGGLYGIDRLGASVSSSRRSAIGLGVSYGQQKAFDRDYDRFVDTQGLLSGAATAKSDATSPQYAGLRGAGLNSEQIKREDPASLSIDFMHQLPKLFKNADDPNLGAIAHGRGLDSIMSLDDIRRYLRSSPKERDAQDKAYAADSKSMDVTPATQTAWQDLTTQLGRAKDQIESTLVTELGKLTPEFTELSASATKLVGDFLKSDVIKADLDNIASGLSAFDKALNDPNSWWNKAGKALDTFSKAEHKAGEDSNHWLLGKAPWLNPNNIDWYSGNNVLTHHAAMRHGKDRVGAPPDAVHARAMEKLKAWGGHPPSDKGGTGFSATPDGGTGAARAGRGRNDTGTLPDAMPPTAAQPGDEHAKQGEVASYIRARAAAEGIDPNTAVRVSMSEGLRGWDTGRDGPSHAGDYNTSFGAYQLHYGGSGIPGMNAMGLGDDFTKQTGMDARDPKTWRAQVDFALHRAAKAGWTDWHGAANTGISKWEGIGTYRGPVPGAVASTTKPSGFSIVGSAEAAERPAPAKPSGFSATPDGRAVTPSPFGAIGDRAAFDAEQRRAAGRQSAGDADLLRRYHEQRAMPITKPVTTTPSVPKAETNLVTATGVPAKANAAVSEWTKLVTALDKSKSSLNPLIRVENDRAKLAAEHAKGQDDIHRHFLNMKTVLGAHQGHAKPWQNHDFVHAVREAHGMAGIRRAQQEGPAAARNGPERTSSLSGDRFQRKRGHDISIQNNSGGNVNAVAGPASYG